MARPEHIIVKQQIYDPSIEEYVKVELPTETIKKFRRVSGPASRWTLASYTGLGNVRLDTGGSFDAVGRCIRMSVTADRAQEFWIIDRKGTIDDIYLQAAGRDVAYGKWDAPLYVFEGTVKVEMGSVTAGTFTAAFELIKPILGTKTVR